MGQYYIPYIQTSKGAKTFSSVVDGDWNGLKLMEHSWWHNYYVGQVVNAIFYKKARVCWVGDYYAEDDCSQVNCDKATVYEIGQRVWNDNASNYIKETPSKKTNVRFLDGCYLVNHTKKQILDCSKYNEENRYIVRWNGDSWEQCVNPLPLLTCSASHSGGSYGGINHDKCGIWFNDELEVVLWDTYNKLKKRGYTDVMFHFTEQM